MSMFDRRKAEEQQGPRPVETLTRVSAPPSHATASAAPPPPRPAQPIEQGSTSIGRSVIIRGEIHSQEDLVVDGQIEGSLDLGKHRLVIGPNGKVRAAIGAREVDVHGAVDGNVEAAERIILRKNSRMVGDLKMTSVVIEDGAYFKGSIDIHRAEGSNPAARPVVAGGGAVTSA